MTKEEKCISLELAKQIDAEHKRLGITPPESEWIWLLGRIDDGYGLERCGVKKFFDKHDIYYNAYDASELGKMLPSVIDYITPKGIYTKAVYMQDQKGTDGIICYEELESGQNFRLHFVYTDKEAKCRGKMYLWLLQNGYIKGA